MLPKLIVVGVLVVSHTSPLAGMPGPCIATYRRGRIRQRTAGLRCSGFEDLRREPPHGARERPRAGGVDDGGEGSGPHSAQRMFGSQCGASVKEIAMQRGGCTATEISHPCSPPITAMTVERCLAAS